MKFKNIEALGLAVWHDCEWEDDAGEKGFTAPMVDAWQLEKLLESAQVVYGQTLKDHGMRWEAGQVSTDTHSAKLLCTQPIVKGVTKAEIVEVLEARNKNGNYDLLLQRILAEGIRND